MRKIFFLLMLLILITCEKEGKIYEVIKNEDSLKIKDSSETEIIKNRTSSSLLQEKTRKPTQS